MLVFIDDSGDSGFKFNRGSSPYFVIACVVFDDNLEAEKASLAIKILKRKLGLSDAYEFKFTKSSKSHRQSFLRAIADINFRIRAIRVNKLKIKSDILKQNKGKFYNYIIKLVLQHSGQTITNANIILDGTADKVYIREALGYFKKELNKKDNKVIKKIGFRKSHNNPLIQLADMVAGSINRGTQTDKKDAKDYIQILQDENKIQDLWDFP